MFAKETLCELGLLVFLTTQVSYAVDCSTSFDNSCLHAAPYDAKAASADEEQKQRAAKELEQQQVEQQLEQCPGAIADLNLRLQQVDEEAEYRKAQALIALDSTSSVGIEYLPKNLPIDQIPEFNKLVTEGAAKRIEADIMGDALEQKAQLRSQLVETIDACTRLKQQTRPGRE